MIWLEKGHHGSRGFDSMTIVYLPKLAVHFKIMMVWFKTRMWIWEEIALLGSRRQMEEMMRARRYDPVRWVAYVKAHVLIPALVLSTVPNNKPITLLLCFTITLVRKLVICSIYSYAYKFLFHVPHTTVKTYFTMSSDLQLTLFFFFRIKFIS